MKDYGYFTVVVDKLLDDNDLDNYSGDSWVLVSMTYANGKYVYIFKK